jgi:hypothetical protein
MTDARDSSTAAPATSAPSAGDRVLLFAFWAWAVVLVIATIATVFHLQGVLDVLDVKRWFSR